MKTNGKHQLAVITGASSGIGLELARCFAQDHYDLVIVAEDEPGLRAAAQALREDGAPQVEIVVADLARRDAAQKVRDRVNALGRPVDVLVNNAGVGVYGDFTRETSLDEEITMIEVNTIAYVQMAKLFAPEMVARGHGRILITASVASVTPTPLQTVYGATKAFTYELAMGLREELRGSGVTVTALMPGPTDTNFFERAHAMDSKMAHGRLANAADVARAGYDALMKDEARVITPFRWAVQTTLDNVVPEPIVARVSHKMHERVNEKDRDEVR